MKMKMKEQAIKRINKNNNFMLFTPKDYLICSTKFDVGCMIYCFICNHKKILKDVLSCYKINHEDEFNEILEEL